jgi:hypothetical protein
LLVNTGDGLNQLELSKDQGVAKSLPPLILSSRYGTTLVDRSQFVKDTGLSIEGDQYVFSNVLEYKPGPIGELPVDGFPHHMDDAGYRSDGQHPCEDRRNWHGKRHPLSINRGLCIPAYHLQINPRDNGDRVLIPCLLTPDEKGKLEQEVSIAASRSVEVTNVPVVRYALLTQFLSENDRFEDDTEVPNLNFVYPWDDATDDLFTRDRKRLDQEYGKETEFPADVPERRLRMHPKKLARRLELFTAVLTMLRPINITIWDFTGRKESSGNQRESATLFPQGLSLYSRRAVLYSRRAALLFPQGWRSSPGHSAPARPAPTAMAGIRVARHAGPRR